MSSNGVRPAKFMQSALLRPRDRTTNVEQLRRFTPDTKVPYERILIAVVMAIVLIVATIALFVFQGPQLKYTWPALLMFFFGGLIFVILYILPSRNESLLMSSMKLLYFQVLEKMRMSSGKALVSTFGITKVYKNGLIKFDNGDFGKLFHVEGHIGQSTLPKVAEDVAMKRAEYLVSRSSTSSELLISSVNKLKLDKQFDYYNSVIAQNSGPSLQERWRSSMMKLERAYSSEYVHDKNTSVRQYLIIRDADKMSLEKSISQHAAATYNGMLSYRSEVTDRRGVLEILAPIVLNTSEGRF